jgi:hypothetical protein
VRALFVLLIGAAGCQVSLDGVPVVEPETGEDAGEGDGDGDAGWPGYRHDFAVADGPVAHDGWQAMGGAEVWGERLCLRDMASAKLPLKADAYGYLRVDFPLHQPELEMHAETEDGDLFVLRWSSPFVMVNDVPIADLSGWLHRGDALANERAGAFELELNFDERALKGRLRGESWADVAFDPRAAGTKLASLRFVGPEVGVACLDNVFVSDARPDRDPFESAQAVNVCVPSAPDLISRCVTQNCCAQAVAQQKKLCAAADADCESSSCPCTWVNFAACAASCLIHHPSHSVSDCSLLCRAQMSTDGAWPELATCADTCSAQPAGGPPEDFLMPHLPELDALEPTAADARMLLALSRDDEGALTGSARLSILALGSEPRNEHGFIRYVEGDTLQLFAEPSHARWLVFVSSEVSGRPGRLYARDDGDGSTGFKEVLFNAGVIAVRPSSTLLYAWVMTESHISGTRHLYLINADGRAVFDYEGSDLDLDFDEFGFGPKDRYAYARLGGEAVTMHFPEAWTQRATLPEDGWPWRPILRFEDSIAWLSHVGPWGREKPSEHDWLWLDMYGQTRAGELPQPPEPGAYHLRRADYVASPEGLFVALGRAPVRLASLPASFEESTWEPLVASSEHVLYKTWDGLSLSDVDGNILGSVDASTHHLVTYGPDRLLAGNEAALTSYVFDGEAFASGVVSGQSLLPVDVVATRPGSSLVVVRSHPDSIVYDLATGESVPYTSEAVWSEVWATYPRASPPGSTWP